MSPRLTKKLRTLKELKPEADKVDERINLLVRGVSPSRLSEKRSLRRNPPA
jgi:hypothetical protein